MSQEQLAAKAGLSYKFVGEVERGTGNPTVDTLAALSDALGVDAPELFGEPTGRRPASRFVTISTQDWERLRASSEAISGVVRGSDRSVGPVRRLSAKQ